MTSVSGSVKLGEKVEASVENSNTVGRVTVSESVSAEAQSGLFIEGSASVTSTDVQACASFAEGDKASVTVAVEASDATTGFHAGAEGTVTVQSGTFVDASVQAGAHGVAADASASIGSSVGVDGSVTEGSRYSSVTAGAGVSVGEQFSVGGGGEATYSKGVVTVGVSGDVAALVGIDVDVKESVDLGKIASDAEKASKTVAQGTVQAANTVADQAKDTGNKVAKESKSVWNKTKKFFGGK
jgi:hypothetical protein